MDCSSYRLITLLSIPGKVVAHVLLARIQPIIDLTSRPEQSSFVAGRSTIDAILALRLLSELHREFDRPLNVVCLDIKAAFDSVDRRAIWKALRSRGVPAILLGASELVTRWTRHRWRLHCRVFSLLWRVHRVTTSPCDDFTVTSYTTDVYSTLH